MKTKEQLFAEVFLFFWLASRRGETHTDAAVWIKGYTSCHHGPQISTADFYGGDEWDCYHGSRGRRTVSLGCSRIASRSGPDCLSEGRCATWRLWPARAWPRSRRHPGRAA